MEQDRNWEAGDFSDEHFQVRRCGSFMRQQRRANGISSVRHIPLGLPAELMRFKPHAIITGELGARTALAHVAGSALGAAVIPWTYQADPSSRSVAIRGIQAYMARNSPAVIGMGQRARNTLEIMGCNPERIHDAPNSADIDTIRNRLSHESHHSAVRAIKNRFNGKRIAAVVGRMIAAKSIRLIVDAWKQLPSAIHDDWVLVFTGDGSERHITEGQEHYGIHCTGAVAPEQVMDWMTAADLHIFGSIADPWGLVVNEAMHCGTPTLCSVRAGCFDNLITDGLNGFAFDPRRGHSHTSEAMARAMMNPRLAELGCRARADAAKYTPTRMAKGMANAVTTALLQRQPISKESYA